MGRSGGGSGGGSSGGSGSFSRGPTGHSGGGGSFGGRGRSSGGRNTNHSSLAGMAGRIGQIFTPGSSTRSRQGGYGTGTQPGGPSSSTQNRTRSAASGGMNPSPPPRSNQGGFAAMGRSGGGFSGGGFGGGGGSFGGGPSGHSGGGGSFGGGGRSSGGPGRSGGGFDGGGFGGGGGGGYRGGGPRFPMFGGPMLGMGRLGCGTIVVIVVLVGIFLMASMFADTGGTSAADERGITASTTAREKLPGSGYKNEVYDELGWFSNTNSVANNIRHFYDVTGVQPVIYLENRPDLIGNVSAQEAEAERIYKELGLGDDAFLFVYFDNDGTDGDWTTWVGNSAGTVMDANAIQIFGDYLNQYWFSNATEDEMFENTFNKTADRIMSRTTNANDVAIYVWIALAIAAAGIAIFVIAKQRRKHQAERAAETERILKADVKDLTNDDELLKRYQENKK